MLQTIWKYTFPKDQSEYEFSMPVGATILSVNVQYGFICLWARVDPMGERETRSFRLVGTGHPVGSTDAHLGTVLLYDGRLVIHVFERITS